MTALTIVIGHQEDDPPIMLTVTTRRAPPPEIIVNMDYVPQLIKATTNERDNTYEWAYVLTPAGVYHDETRGPEHVNCRCVIGGEGTGHDQRDGGRPSHPEPREGGGDGGTVADDGATDPFFRAIARFHRR